MNSRAPARTQVFVAILALTAALFARAYLQIILRESGYDKLYAADLSYLVVPPILTLLLFPVLKQNSLEIRRQFAVTKLSAPRSTVPLPGPQLSLFPTVSVLRYSSVEAPASLCSQPPR